MTYGPDMTQLRSTPKFPFYEIISHLGIIKHQQKYFFSSLIPFYFYLVSLLSQE